jgi:hypothetical protein
MAPSDSRSVNRCAAGFTWPANFPINVTVPLGAMAYRPFARRKKPRRRMRNNGRAPGPKTWRAALGQDILPRAFEWTRPVPPTGGNSRTVAMVRAKVHVTPEV